MKKLQLKDLHPETARGFRFLMVPSELIENEEYADLDDSAKLLYSKMIERAGWSACNEDKFSDKNGRLFIIYTVEQILEPRCCATERRWFYQDKQNAKADPTAKRG